MKHKSGSPRERVAAARSSELKQNPNKAANASYATKQVHQYLVGAGTVFDVAGSHLRYPALGSVADDMTKIQKDFWVIGDDMRIVLRNQVAHLKR